MKISRYLSRICNHEADPTTIEYDKKYGRKALCKKCGEKIYLINFVKPKKVMK